MQLKKQITNEPSVIHQNRQFILGAALIATILFAYYFYTWRNAYNFRAAMDVCTKPFCDLADYYYPMGEAIFKTKLPVEGFVYSPLIAILNMGLIFGIQRARLPHADLWSFHLIFISIPFILMTSWPVDLVYMPFGQALLAWKILEGDNALSWKHPLPARKVASLLLLASIVISNIVFFNLIGDRVTYGSVGFIFWANLLLLVVSYMELLPSVLQQIRMKGNRLVGQDG